jgi:hypothetical protein
MVAALRFYFLEYVPGVFVDAFCNGLLFWLPLAGVGYLVWRLIPKRWRDRIEADGPPLYGGSSKKKDAE